MEIVQKAEDCSLSIRDVESVSIAGVSGSSSNRDVEVALSLIQQLQSSIRMPHSAQAAADFLYFHNTNWDSVRLLQCQAQAALTVFL